MRAEAGAFTWSRATALGLQRQPVGQERTRTNKSIRKSVWTWNRPPAT